MARFALSSCVVLLVMVFSASGFGLPDVADVTGVELPKDATYIVLLPSQVHEAFSDLDSINPFETEPLEYLHTEMPDYDEFFLEAAQLRGTIELAHQTLQLTQTITDPSMISRALSDEQYLDSLEGSEYYVTLTTLRDYIPATMEGLSALPNTITELTSAATSLASSAPGDFAGVNAVHLPMIIEELTNTTNYLTGIPGEAATLITELQAIVPGI